jgi:hypothetical protein
MSAPPETALVRELRAHINKLERQNADLERQVTELRAAVAALLAPPKEPEYGVGKLYTSDRSAAAP